MARYLHILGKAFRQGHVPQTRKGFRRYASIIMRGTPWQELFNFRPTSNPNRIAPDHPIQGASSLSKQAVVNTTYIFLLTKKKIWINVYGRIGPETNMPAKLKEELVLDKRWPK